MSSDASATSVNHGEAVDVRVSAHDRDRLERLCRYVLRPPVAQDRLRLTPSAESLFPKQYELLAERLMEAIASEVGPDALHRIFANWENELASRLDRSLPADEDERLNGLARHQSSFGFMASVHRARTGAALIEQNCPIAAIAARFPEICDHEAALFRRVLGRDVELRACQARGGLRCEFLVGEPPQTPPGEP